jgi:hypothetical protein
VGANGVLKPGAKPSAGKLVEGLDAVGLPGVVAGGGEPEPADRAREAAPGRLQGLGRLVSVSDYETEVLAIPGVTRAAAEWGISDGVPTLSLLVLLAAGREAEFLAIKDVVLSFHRCRGANRFPIRVQQALSRYAYLDVTYSADPALTREAVGARMRTALGLSGDEAAARTGLFGLHRRRLGEREYATRVEGVLQTCEGVAWCRVTGFDLFRAGTTDPTDLNPPPATRPCRPRLVPAANELIRLHPRHLSLTPTAAALGDCS